MSEVVLKAPLSEALDRIRTLATQIPSSSPFASAALAREILDYVRRVHSLRMAISSAGDKTDLMSALRESMKQREGSTGVLSPPRSAGAEP